MSEPLLLTLRKPYEFLELRMQRRYRLSQFSIYAIFLAPIGGIKRDLSHPTLVKIVRPLEYVLQHLNHA